MRTWFPQHRSMAVLANFALVATLWGAPPQEGRGPNFQSAGSGDRVIQATPALLAQTPSAQPNQRSGPSQRSMGFVPARLNRVYIYAGTGTVVPPGWARCMSMPNLNYWEQRDITKEIQWLARTGFIPVSPIGDTVDVLSD